MKISVTRWAVLLAGALFVSVSVAQAQEPTDTISGSVKLSSGAPIGGVEVKITAAGSVQSVSTRTDSSGNFLVLSARGSQYLVFARAADGSVVRGSQSRSESGRTNVDLVFTAAKTTLPTVSVRSRRAPSSSRMDGGFEQTEADVPLIGGETPPSDQGTLSAALELVPGAAASANGFSVLGLGSEQSRTTFNGIQVGSLTLPRSTPVVARLNTSPHDVSKGGFSGGLLSVQPQPASNFITTNLGISAQPLLSQANDPLSRLSARQENNFSADFARTAPLGWDKVAYTVSAQAGRRSHPLSSLLTLNESMASALATSALATAAFEEALAAAGIPSLGPPNTSQSVTNEGSFLARIDLTPSENRRTSVTTLASYAGANILGVAPTSTPATGLNSKSLAHSIQLTDDRTFNGLLLNEFTVGYSASQYRTRRLSAIPAGLTFLHAATDSQAVVPASFGGAAAGPQSDERLIFQFSNATSWYSKSGEHLWKASLEAQEDRLDNRAEELTLGQYTFSSVGNISTNSASVYSRDSGPSIARATFRALSGSFGDTWQRETGFSFQYGLRLDAYKPIPQFDQERLGDLSILSMPLGSPGWAIGLSPRVAFSRKFILSAARPGVAASSMVLSGGIGAFRATNADAVLSPLMQAGWQSSRVSRLVCIGDAVPQPTWELFKSSPATIPARCISAAGTNFEDSSLGAAVLDKGFRTPTSWRTDLAASTRVRSVRLEAGGVVSWNVSQPDLRDLNQIDRPAFVLSNEGNRPVFVEPGAISDEGVLFTRSNRIDPSYHAVWVVRSGLRALSRQLSLSISPISSGPFLRRSWRISYVESRVTESLRGFDGSTVGDPLNVDRASGRFESRHQFLITGSTIFGPSDRVEISGYARINSGFHFTPLVAQDINGDGLINDRPWIFAADAATGVSAGLQRLLSNAPRYAATCVSKQAGQFAAPQSCAGPWSVSSTLNLKVRGDAFRLSPRSQVTLSVVNVAAIADRLLHGSDAHGWGQLPFVDPYLYTVAGFDRRTNQFAYSVNPRFGSALSVRSLSRNPFRINLGVFIPVGPTWGAQAVESDLAVGRSRPGPRKTADEMTNEQVIAVIGFDPLSRIGRGSDSSRYSISQRKAIQDAISRRDSVLRTVFREAAIAAESLGPDPSPTEKRQILRLRASANDSAIAALIAAGESIKAILSVDQIERLPATTRIYLNRDDILYLRSRQGFIY